MVQSRIHKIGSIFSRAAGLLRSGAMKWEDRPLWYDIYARFPPKKEPKWEQQAKDRPIQSLLYPEDSVRARFYKTFGSPGIVDLIEDSSKTRIECQIFADKYYEIAKSSPGSSEDEIFEKTTQELQSTMKLNPLPKDEN